VLTSCVPILIGEINSIKQSSNQSINQSIMPIGKILFTGDIFYDLRPTCEINL